MWKTILILLDDWYYVANIFVANNSLIGLIGTSFLNYMCVFYLHRLKLRQLGSKFSKINVKVKRKYFTPQFL